MNQLPLMDQVLTLINSLPYASVPKDMVDTISQLPRKETLASLKEVALTMNGELSDRAIDAILQIDPEYGKSVLLEVWNRPDWEWFFCYSAFDYGDDSFVKPLCEILQDSSNPTNRYMAAAALVFLGNAEAIEALTLALKDPGEDYEGRKISSEAAIALKAINDRKRC